MKAYSPMILKRLEEELAARKNTLTEQTFEAENLTAAIQKNYARIREVESILKEVPHA